MSPHKNATALVVDAVDTDTCRHATQPASLQRRESGDGNAGQGICQGARPLRIHANALVPGAIAAGGFVAQPEMARHIPLGRLGTADDLAPMALAVLSERVGGYVTDASIVVDGGIALSNWFGPSEFDPEAGSVPRQPPT